MKTSSPGTVELFTPDGYFGGVIARALGRTVGVLTLLTQLQGLPGALLCEREHREPVSHCQGPIAAGPALTAQAPAPDSPCALFGPCLAHPGAAVLASGLVLTAPDGAAGVPASQGAPPPSADHLPTSPPPQA